MKKFLSSLLKKLNAIAKDYFAEYVVKCDNGTYILCWTEKEALSWLPYCGKSAEILETYDYRVLVQRVQG